MGMAHVECLSQRDMEQLEESFTLRFTFPQEDGIMVDPASVRGRGRKGMGHRYVRETLGFIALEVTDIPVLSSSMIGC